MKTIINPKAVKIELTIRLSIQALETEGWDFDSYHQNTADHYGISFEEAAQRNYNSYEAELRVYGSADDLKVLVGWHNVDSNDPTDKEESGDDKKSIEDICNLIDSGEISINENWDYSVDESDKYCPAFIQLVEA